MSNPTDIASYSVTVPEDKGPMRLDRFLADRLDDLSRSRIKALIEAGEVLVTRQGEGKALKDPSFKVRAGDRVDLTLPEPLAAEPIAQNIPLEVYYEDDDVIVFEKPVGMVVHPAAGNPDGTLVNALLGHCGDSLSGIGGVARPGIVHRLDKDTSGIMVAAKNDLAHQKLAAQFADHSLERTYKAVVWGCPQPLEGEIEGNIGRSPQNRKKMAVVPHGGKWAKTAYKVLERYGDPLRPAASLVECNLATGRTHQIRVHMTHIGHPLIGDPLYGRAKPSALKKLSPEDRAWVLGLNTQALHADVIGFKHPKSGEIIRYKSSISKNIKDLTSILEKI